MQYPVIQTHNHTHTHSHTHTFIHSAWQTNDFCFTAPAATRARCGRCCPAAITRRPSTAGRSVRSALLLASPPALLPWSRSISRAASRCGRRPYSLAPCISFHPWRPSPDERCGVRPGKRLPSYVPYSRSGGRPQCASSGPVTPTSPGFLHVEPGQFSIDLIMKICSHQIHVATDCANQPA